MDDQTKLRKVSRFINDHLKHPNRTPMERMIALGKARMDGLNGRLSPKAALKAWNEIPPPQDYSWRVEAITEDGKRWQNGVRLRTKEEAEVYIQSHVRFNLKKSGYVTAKIIRCEGEESNCGISRARAKGRPTLNYEEGQGRLLNWHKVT